MEGNSNRVFFVQAAENGEYETESLWCQKVENGYAVDNIPFIVKGISLGDVISLEFDEDDQQYYFEDLVSRSGNSTIRIVFFNREVDEVRDWLNKKNCESEVLLAKNLVAVNIPHDVDYLPIKQYLDKGEEAGIWSYEESCLVHEY